MLQSLWKKYANSSKNCKWNHQMIWWSHFWISIQKYRKQGLEEIFAYHAHSNIIGHI